ncbi:hypothetical protein FG91_01232 [Sphingopyxis sp. LC81]|uniref:tail fiber domain-containing protein n=1 Tax=Sphingopyxis sp. LC81 TaxID=1502850 RepID=UPI00050F0AF2|nr:tail fiber domain-containing protein [Sphingopyxis sp. LC81]KGB55627.1 hypothetical protein FG91_01232 [Sphingopyxis sp. LC81]
MPTYFFADLVRELCQDGGTGPLMPTGAVPGHRRFSGTVPAGDPFHYAIAGIAQPGQWEVGIGRIDGAGRLQRDSVAASSNAGDRVDFAPGLKTIALTVGAEWFAAHDAAGSDLADALAAKQPLSTAHPAAAAGAVDDRVTVRRGEGWVNIPLSALAFRAGDGRYALDGPLGVQNGSAAAPAISFATDPDTGLFRAAADAIGIATDGVERGRFLATGPQFGGAEFPRLQFVRNGSATWYLGGSGTGGDNGFYLQLNAVSPFMAALANGNVGFGTTNPVKKFVVSNGGANGFEIDPGEGAYTRVLSYNRSGGAYTPLILEGSDIQFAPGGGAGGCYNATGLGVGVSPGARFHVKSSGEIVRLETTSARGVGQCYIALRDPAGNKGFLGYSAVDDGFDIWNALNSPIRFGTNGSYRWQIRPSGSIEPMADNAYAIGHGSFRPSILYAATGTINTSDAREKTWRGAPDAAEMRAAQRIAAELGFYQWNDAIAAKGAGSARYHFGVRAQRVWTIMAEEGLVAPLDADGRPGATPYAFLCWDAWEDGEEARDRFGIRPDQLVLFLIAAQEARLAALEAAA